MKKDTNDSIMMQDSTSLNKTQTVGDVLKNARLAQKKDLDEIATILRIKSSFLEALESSNYSVFPGNIYALGFLRTYSNFLGTDTNTLLKQYKTERNYTAPENINMPTIEIQPIYPSIKVLICCLIFAFIAIYIWYSHTNYSQVIQIQTPQTQNDNATIKPQVDSPVVLPDSISEQNPNAVSVNEQKESTEKSKTKEAEQQIKIVATGDVWIEINQEDTLIFSQLLKAGEVYIVPQDKDSLMLKTGSAGNMDIFVGEQKVKSFGKVGTVRSHIPLIAEALLNR